MKTAQSAMHDNITEFEKLYISDFHKWIYQIKVNVNVKEYCLCYKDRNKCKNCEESNDFKDPSSTLEMSLLDLVILTSRNKVLKILLEKEISIDNWKKPILIKDLEDGIETKGKFFAECCS